MAQPKDIVLQRWWRRLVSLGSDVMARVYFLIEHKKEFAGSAIKRVMLCASLLETM